jgi:protein-S-isoprenylcysteine O-methyltransferase Ste14
MSASAAGPVAVPPPVIYVTALLLGLWLDQLSPISPLPESPSYAIGTLLVVASVLIVPFAFLRFRRAGTPFNVRKPATALVTDGPYRYSRNPGYVALTLFYLGIALLLRNVWVLLMAAPALVVMDLWVVRSEERHLEERFGEEYAGYKRTVRRWL